MTQMHALPDSRQAPCASERASCVWRFVRLLMRWRYGVRGAIKPPINWNRANSLWYRWRYRCWRIEEGLYQRTGLPNEWWAWVRGETLPQMLRKYADEVAGGGPSDGNYDPDTLMLLSDAADALEGRKPNNKLSHEAAK